MPLLIAIAALVLLYRHFRTTPTQPGSAANGGNGLDNTAEAFAQYEGFYIPGSVAQRTNNPGNVGTFGGKLATYGDAGDGWDALNGWLTSHAAANPNWDFYDLTRYYLTGDTMGTPGPGQNPDAYAEYVASYLGVDPTTPVSQVLGS